MPRSYTRTGSSEAVSSYWTMRLLPTTIIWRTLRGASHESCTLAVIPPAKVSVRNAVSGTPSRNTQLPDAATSTTGSLEPVEQDREVVRREVADDAVALVLAEVHARGGDEVDVADDAAAGSGRAPC